MSANHSESTEKMFSEFNEDRKALAKQFYELMNLVANDVFTGASINISKKENLLEQINKQENLVEAEKNLLRNLYFYATNLQESQFLLGVFGRFKAGKSTLINTLAGENISPMDTRISTGVLNFTYSSDVEKCTVHYDNGTEEKIDPATKDEFIDFRYNPDNEKGIHSVRHGCPNLDLQKEIVFVDTPGLEAVNSVHEKITLDFVTQCHVAVVVSTYPPFGEGELRFYKRIHENIPNTFLVQNLPADKLSSWVPLEAQTLENLHKLGFYTLNQNIYSNREPAEILRTIGDDKNEKELIKFKEAHNIHLYTLNALMAYDILKNKKSSFSLQEEETLNQSRFLLFKKDLYHFLTNHRGQKLLADYLRKGHLILNELTNMVQQKQKILQESLEEIERRIQSEEQHQKKTLDLVDLIVDRTALKILEFYKVLKTSAMDQDFEEALGDVKSKYAEKNIYRLKKNELKEIKSQIAIFNRLFGQRYQNFVKSLSEITEKAQKDIENELKNHSLFKPISLEANSGAITVGEISGAGYLDRGFDFAFHGGMAFITGSIAGGTGISLLTPIVAVGVGISAAPLVAAAIGGVIGLTLSIPLSKKMAPFLDNCKALIGKIYSKPTSLVFEEFRSNIRQKLDDVEAATVDQLQKSFKGQVQKGAEEFFELINKNLKELRDKKENGNESQENEKLCSILEQLTMIQQHFSSMEKTKNVTEQKDSVLKGIKGLLGKFKK